jgi:hypothetical protein
MPKLKWDEVGSRLFETGLDRGVLYPKDKKTGEYLSGVVWNGLTGLSEAPDGAEASPQYADNIKYLNLISAENFKGSISAFTYPDEWAECDGSAQAAVGVSFGQQTRRGWGLSYRTLVGNDIEGTDYGYQIHLVYGGQASPSSRDRATVNDSPEAVGLSWDFETVPAAVTADGFKPTAHVVIDSTKASKAAMDAIEAVIYGGTEEARLPLPDEVLEIMGGVATDPEDGGSEEEAPKKPETPVGVTANFEQDGSLTAEWETSADALSHLLYYSELNGTDTSKGLAVVSGGDLVTVVKSDLGDVQDGDTVTVQVQAFDVDPEGDNDAEQIEFLKGIAATKGSELSAKVTATFTAPAEG